MTGALSGSLTMPFAAILAGAGKLPEPIMDAEKLTGHLVLVTYDAEALGLDGTADRIKHIREYVAANPSVVDFGGDVHLSHDLRVLRETLIDELQKRWVFIPELDKYRKYFSKSFGDEVDEAFPDAQADIFSACNCYVYDESTASVFHSMRVAENGLRALTIHFDPSAKPSKSEWGPLIRDLNKIIEALHEQNKTPEPDRQTKLDFYSEAFAQCRFFKRWRDAVSHTNGYYEAAEALRALTHVEEFMRLLANNGITLPARIAP